MKKHVLVVEDEADIQTIIKTTLEGADYAVAMADNGQEALDLIATGVHPDILLLDLVMPTMDGYRLLAELQQRKLIKEFSILVMSADNFTQQHMERLGIQGFVSKPFDLDDLLTAVEAA